MRLRVPHGTAPRLRSAGLLPTQLGGALPPAPAPFAAAASHVSGWTPELFNKDATLQKSLVLGAERTSIDKEKPGARSA